MSWVFVGRHGPIIVEADFSRLTNITRMQQQSKDLTPLLKGIANAMRRSFADQFAKGGDPTWQPLAPSTIAAKLMASLPNNTSKNSIPWRTKQSGDSESGSTLIGKGGLSNSYAILGALGNIERIDLQDGSVTVGSNYKSKDGVSLARIHQHGTKPYQIRPRTKKALAFGSSAGELLLRRAVSHPGVPARPIRVREIDRSLILRMCRAHFAGRDLDSTA